MPSLNKTIILGNLCRETEVRYTKEGNAYAVNTIASNRRYQHHGEWKADTLWLRIKAWGKQAEYLGRVGAKGALMLLEGRLESRSWPGPNGERREAVELVCQKCVVLVQQRKDGTLLPNPDEELPPGAIPADQVDTPAEPTEKPDDEIPF